MLQVEIVIRSEIDPRWSDWLEGLTITPAGHGVTTLTGVVVDQSALYGLIARLRDLGLPLASIRTCDG